MSVLDRIDERLGTELLVEQTLTKMHFMALATIIKQAKTKDALAKGLVSWLKTMNPKFDETKFKEAAGMK